MYLERAAVLIDGCYSDKVHLSFNIPTIDIVKFSNNICDACERFKTYYFDALPWVSQPPSPTDLQRRQRKQQYLDNLKMLHRIEVRLGKVQRKEIKR